MPSGIRDTEKDSILQLRSGRSKYGSATMSIPRIAGVDSSISASEDLLTIGSLLAKVKMKILLRASMSLSGQCRCHVT